MLGRPKNRLLGPYQAKVFHRIVTNDTIALSSSIWICAVMGWSKVILLASVDAPCATAPNKSRWLALRADVTLGTKP